jgi:NOL1/NOP2/sun family putative RNA methylase
MSDHPQQALFDFYKSIIPDPAAFLSCALIPLAKTYWVNALRTSKNVFDDTVSSSIGWNKYAYRYTGEQSLGTTWQYKIGLIQIQEEVSMLPVKLLDPQPHEKIIDLCAAPGNKTAEIGVAMNNTGTLVANDRNFQRMKAMGQIIRRVGLCNITMTVQDALNYQAYPEYFDKVLVDAPCSCEGTFRKRPGKPVKPSPKQHRHLASRQIAIMKKAIQLCKPGGRIVYSTCTFAPEENEGVVTAILNGFSNKVRIIPIKLDGFNWCEGISEWHGEQFHPDVKHTMRVWPHLNNTGGFYVAVFEKYQGDNFDYNIKDQVFESSADITHYLDDLKQRYGFSSELMQQYILQQASNRGIYMVNRDHKIPEGLSKDVSGLVFMKTGTNFPKLATGAAAIIGKHASANILSLNDAQFDSYLKREDCVLLQDQLKNCASTGFVIVFYKEHIAGLGLYLSAEGDKPPRLRSLFPKSI